MLRYQFITPDNFAIDLHNPPKSAVISYSGWGAPAYDIQTTRGPFQHADDLISFRLNPRRIQTVIRFNGSNKSEYWNIRSRLLDYMRMSRSNPNYPSAGHLQIIYLEDGEVKKRKVDAVLVSGLEYGTDPDVWDEYSIQERLEFLCYDPVIYDPTDIEVPLSIGTTNVSYDGTFETFPVITVEGPATDFTVYNTVFDYQITLTYTISAGETVTIDLTSTTKTVYNNSNDDLISYLSPSSDLNAFSLQPHPIVYGGTNFIQCATTSGAPTSINMTYKNRYIGI